MSESEVHKVIIIGSGPAGLTAAIYAARANLSPVLIHGPLPGGQLTTTTEVENFPGFPEGINGPELMQKMEAQARRFGAFVMETNITSVDLSAQPFKIVSEKGTLLTKTLIIATGATPRLVGAPGERELMGWGVSTCATCDGAFYRNKIIMVVGGGDSACEEALFLTRFGSKVYLVHRRDELRASKIMRERVLNHPKITPIWNHALKEVIGEKPSGVTGVVLTDVHTKTDQKVAVDGLFVAIGHIPNSKLFKNWLDTDENGYIVAKPFSAQTKVPGVFVSGDVQDHVFRQAITAAGSGCMAAIEAERWLEAQGG